MKVSGQNHAPAALPPEKNSSSHLIGGSVGFRAVLDDPEGRKIRSFAGIFFEPLTVQPVV
jgi:hypothetical protein